MDSQLEKWAFVPGCVLLLLVTRANPRDVNQVLFRCRKSADMLTQLRHNFSGKEFH